MTIAKWCVLAACVLPILTVGLAKASTARLTRLRVDNAFQNYTRGDSITVLILAQFNRL